MYLYIYICMYILFMLLLFLSFATLISPFKKIVVKINNNLQRFLTCRITILDNHACVCLLA